MRTIKIKFEYGCFPVWLYDEEGFFIDNILGCVPIGINSDAGGKATQPTKSVCDFRPALPVAHKMIQNRCAVKAAWVGVQEVYEKLFVNNDTEFKYIGFQSEEQKAEFTSLFGNAVDLLCKAVGNKYAIVNTVDLKNL